MNKDRTGIRHIVLASLFAALAYAATLVIHIKVAGFLTFDVKDAIICFSSMILGPGFASAEVLVVSTVEMLTVSDTGFLGWIMNVASSLAFSLTGCFFYRRFRQFWSAVAGLTLSVLAQTSVMMVMNLLITPIYTGMSVAQIANMIPKLLLPFNLLKSLINASLVMAIYKPLSVAIKKSGALPLRDGESSPTIGGIRTAFVIVSALAVAAACIALMIIVLKGQFSWK